MLLCYGNQSQRIHTSSSPSSHSGDTCFTYNWETRNYQEKNSKVSHRPSILLTTYVDTPIPCSPSALLQQPGLCSASINPISPLLKDFSPTCTSPVVSSHQIIPSPGNHAADHPTITIILLDLRLHPEITLASPAMFPMKKWQLHCSNCSGQNPWIHPWLLSTSYILI